MTKFTIGDKISVLDKNLKGTIIRLTNYKAVIEDEFGFEEEFSLSNIVLLSTQNDYESSFGAIPVNKVIKKETFESIKNVSRKIKEIDLHMGNLSESTRGMTNHEIVLYQLKAVEKSLRQTDKRYFHKIIFIHGIGKGKLRYELELLLNQKNIIFQAASFKKYGSGAIEVII